VPKYYFGALDLRPDSEGNTGIRRHAGWVFGSLHGGVNRGCDAPNVGARLSLRSTDPTTRRSSPQGSWAFSGSSSGRKRDLAGSVRATERRFSNRSPPSFGMPARATISRGGGGPRGFGAGAGRALGVSRRLHDWMLFPAANYGHQTGAISVDNLPNCFK
jgi:hypothetical protein